MLLFEGARLFDEKNAVTAEVVRNKLNPALWGLKNLSSGQWECTLPNGTEKEIPTGGAAPIFVGTSIKIGDEAFSIEE